MVYLTIASREDCKWSHDERGGGYASGLDPSLHLVYMCQCHPEPLCQPKHSCKPAWRCLHGPGAGAVGDSWVHCGVRAGRPGPSRMRAGYAMQPQCWWCETRLGSPPHQGCLASCILAAREQPAFCPGTLQGGLLPRLDSFSRETSKYFKFSKTVAN